MILELFRLLASAPVSDENGTAAWVQRFRAPLTFLPEWSPDAPDRTAYALQLTDQLELVARLDHALEANAVDPCEQCQPTSIRLLGQHGHRAGLSHRLDDQDARHHRPTREVAAQIPLVGPYGLARDHPLTGLQLEHLVDQEERFAVRKDLLDLGPAQGSFRHRTSVGGLSDSLAPASVLPLLQGRFGRDYRYVDRCPSTQRLVGAGDAEGTTAVANEQTEGRGRLGRRWHAPAGTSILCSVLVRPPVPPERLPELTLVAANACVEAIRNTTGLEPTVKEPNDVLISGRKVAGILGEVREGHVVLGIGINVNVPATELPERPQIPATSLLEETGMRMRRATLLVELLTRLESSYTAWVQSTEP